jgi:hypothetical protein
MCTVSYLPKKAGGFILTSNRDERVARSTRKPLAYSIGNTLVFFPKDQVAGGTWIAAADNGRICCLLNGAFVNHERKLPYGKSRGKVVLEAFEYEDVTTFFDTMDLSDVEPFTLIVFEQTDSPKLYEFRWDGNSPHLRLKDLTKPHIWSSATLYSKQVREARETWFSKWVKVQDLFTREKALDFHTSTYSGNPENDFIMDRQNGLKTVSITQIEYDNDLFSMHYHDLLSNQSNSLSKQIIKKQYV